MVHAFMDKMGCYQQADDAMMEAALFVTEQEF